VRPTSRPPFHRLPGIVRIAGNSVKIAGIALGRIDELGNPEIHRVADTRGHPRPRTEIDAERRKMRVGQGDAHNGRRRRPDAAQIDDIDVQNLAEESDPKRRCQSRRPIMTSYPATASKDFA
jgi:hypothetical protein